MKYGFYSISQIARAAEKILPLIEKFHLRFFINSDIHYNRKEILCTIQVGKIIKSNNKVINLSHPEIALAMDNIEVNEKREVEKDASINEMISSILYIDLVRLTSSMIRVILNVYEETVEVKIQNKSYSEAIKFLTVERQTDKYNNTHPLTFIEGYKEYLNKRIKDFNELIELDKLDFGIELKEIIVSYKLGLEVNVKGRNLLTPLLAKNYKLLIENLKNSLFIPSFFDIQKKEKERYFHVYLLGVLEGRLNLYNLKSNKESGFGRYDICAFPLNKNYPGFLIEIKSDGTKGSKALDQVKSNNYINELRIEGIKEVLVLAISFKSKEIITDYEIIYL